MHPRGGIGIRNLFGSKRAEKMNVAVCFFLAARLILCLPGPPYKYQRYCLTAPCADHAQNILPFFDAPHTKDKILQTVFLEKAGGVSVCIE